MNSSQMLITMGAMFLLGIVILRVNTNFFTTSDVLLNSKYNIVAISLASSIIEEANSAAFDENSIASDISSLAGLTNYIDLGPDSSEVDDSGKVIRSRIDDFDDFHQFSIRDTFVVDSLLLGIFDINCTVDYVNPEYPETGLLTQTWNKNLEVMVTSTSMTDTVRMSTIYSYWYFR